LNLTEGRGTGIPKILRAEVIAQDKAFVLSPELS
jgi:hypothetical protein